jgi:septal ring factor EnvC (AmiA/AmiB activator)
VAVPTSPGRPPAGARRRLALALLPLSALPVLVAPGTPASAVPAAAPPRDQSLEELRLREQEAAGDLEDSSAAVQQAGAALRKVAAELPGAQEAVARARGELAGARAKAAAAKAALRRAEAAHAAAQSRVTEASERVAQGREDVAQLARQAYQRGRLAGIREIMEAGEPQDVVERASMLRSVFKHQNGTLDRLSRDRLRLASQEAELDAEQRALDAARAEAEQVEQRARDKAEQAEAAAARVEQLVAQRRDALAVAHRHRAEDLQTYREAQAASRALAEKIRIAAAKAEAARKAAEARRAAEAKRKAEEDRRKAAEERKKKPKGSRSAPPRSADRNQGRMMWPAPGRLTSRYGWREHPIYGDRRFHAGIDIGGGYGARVSAAEAGIVIHSGYARGYGTLVLVSHGRINGRNVTTAYAHMGTLSVREGQYVDRGDRVGTIGSEGNSTGPHLHFEVRLDGEPVDPLDWVTPP